MTWNIGAMDSNKAQQLQGLLGALPPLVASRLAKAIEIDRLNEGKSLPHELILDGLRPVLRRGQSYDRAATPLRLFCRPFEDLLSMTPRSQKQKGRIARSSIMPVWNWVSQTLAADAASSFAIGVKTSLLSGRNDEMMNLVKDIELTNNAWAVGRFDVIASRAQLPEQIASQIPPVKWFAAAGHINGGVSGLLRAEARDEQSASQLRDVVRGFLALAQLQGQNDPRVATVAQSLQVGGEGKTVSLSFAVPAEILQLVTPKPLAQ